MLPLAPIRTILKAAVNVGVAAHITASSPGGLRYDPSLTSEQRSAIANAVWLCDLCADVIDRAPAAYPATTLAEWKRISEQAAARDSVVTMDVLTELSQLITETISNITEFCSVWRSEEPGPMFHVDVKTRHHISLSYSSARTSAWQRDILPVVAGIVHHSEGILGPENQIVSTLKKEYPHSQTNYFSMAEVADLLQRLQATLSLR